MNVDPHDCPHGRRFCSRASPAWVLIYLLGTVAAMWWGSVWATAYTAIGLAWELDSLVAHHAEKGNR